MDIVLFRHYNIIFTHMPQLFDFDQNPKGETYELDEMYFNKDKVILSSLQNLIVTNGYKLKFEDINKDLVLGIIKNIDNFYNKKAILSRDLPQGENIELSKNILNELDPIYKELKSQLSNVTNATSLEYIKSIYDNYLRELSELDKIVKRDAKEDGIYKRDTFFYQAYKPKSIFIGNNQRENMSKINNETNINQNIEVSQNFSESNFKDDLEFILQKLYDNCHYKEGKSTKLNNDITFSVFTSEEYEEIQTKINLIRQQTENLLKNSTDGSQKTKYETNLQAANKLLDYITKDKKINNAYLEINKVYDRFFSESFKPKENIEEIKSIPLGIEELIEEKQNLEKQIIVLQNQIKNTNNNDFINGLQKILEKRKDTDIVDALKKELNENKKDKNGNIVKLDGVTLKKYQTISTLNSFGQQHYLHSSIINNPEYEILKSLIKFYEQKIALEKGIEPVKNKLKNLAKKANQANKDIQKANQEQPFKSDKMIESDFKNAEGSTDKLMAYLALLDDQMTDINNGIEALKTTIDELNKENERLKERNQELENSANLIKQEHEQLAEVLKQKNEKGELDISRLNEKNFPILYKNIIEPLKRTLEAQQQTIQDQKAKIAELNQQITEHKEKQEAAQEQIKAIQELLGKQDQKNFDLNGVKEAVRAFIENNAKSLAQQQELQQQLNLQKTNLETKIKQLEQQIIDIDQTNQETLEQKQQELAGLQDQLQKVQTANSELVQQNTKNEQIIKGLREINEQLSQEKQGLDDQIKQNNSDIEKLKQQIETLNKGKNIDSNKIKELEQKITSLTTQNKKLSDQVKDLQKAQVELNTAHQEELENLKLSYQNELNRIKEENIKVQNELSDKYNESQLQLKSQYEQALENQKLSIQNEYNDKIKQLEKKGADDLEQQKQALEAEQQIKLDNLKKQLETEYTTKQQNIKDEYEAEKQQLQKQHDKKVQDLQSQINNKDLLLSGVQEELKQSKINNQHLNEANEQLQSRIAGLEEEVATLTKEADNFKEQYEAQKITNEQLQQKLLKKDKEIENLKTDYENQIKELNNKVEDFITKLDSASEDNLNLLQQINDLNFQIIILNQNVTELQEIQQKLNDDIQKLQQKNQDLLKNNDELKQQNDNYIQQIKTLTQNNDKISQDLKIAEAERNNKIQELQKAVTEKNEIQKQLDNEIKIKGEQSEKAKQLQQQLESKEQEFKTLQDSFAKEQAKVDNLYKNLAISNGKIGALQKQVQIQNKQIEDYKNQMKEANEQIKNSNIIYNELQSQYNILFNENEDNKQKINDLNTKVQGLVSAGEQYANQIKDITAKNGLLVQQLHQNEEDIKLKDDELKKQQDVIKQNNIAIQQKDEEIKQKQGELDVKEKTINDQIAKINEQLVQLDAANKNNEQLTKTKEQLVQNKQDLEKQIETLNTQKQQLETDKSKLETEKQDLQNKQSELQQSHDELSNQLGNIKVQLATANALHKNTVEEQNKQIKMINAKYAELQQQFKTNQEKAQEEIEKNKKEIERLTKEISDKEQQSKEEKQKNEENQQKINELTQANTVLQEAMEGFADKANELEKQAAILQQQAEQAKQEYEKAKQENIQLQKQNQELADQTAQEGEQTNIQQGEAKNTEQIPSQKNNESDNIKDFKEKIDHYETIEWFDHDEIASNGGKDPSKLIKYEVKEFNKFYDDIENYLKSEKEKQQNDTPNQNIDEVEDILQRAKKIKEEYKDILQSNVNYNADNIEDMLHEADKILNRLETSNLDNLNAKENEYLLKYLGDLDNRIEEKITLETDAEERKKLHQYKDHLESLVEKYDNIFNGDNIKNMLDKAELMLLGLRINRLDDPSPNYEEHHYLQDYLSDLYKRINEKIKSETDNEELKKLNQYRDDIDSMIEESVNMISPHPDSTDQNIEQHKNSEQKQKVLESPIGISNRSFAAIQNENVKEPTASELQKQALSEIVGQANLQIGDKQEKKKDDKQEEKKNDQSKDNSKQLANNEDGTEIKHQMSEHKETIDKEIPIIQGSQIERTIINKQGGHPIDTENDLDNIPILTAKKVQQQVQKQDQEIQQVSRGTQTILGGVQENVSAAIKNVNSHIELKGKQEEEAKKISTRGVEQEEKAQNQQFIAKHTSNYKSFTQSNSDRDIFSMNFSSNGDNFSISKTNGNIDMQFDGKTDQAAEFAGYIKDLLENSSKISGREKTKNNFFTTNDTIELSRLEDKLSTKTKELQDGDAIINRQSSILENSDLQDEIDTIKKQINNLKQNSNTISSTIAKKAKDANIEFGSVASVTYNDNSNKPTVSIFEFGNEEKINNYSSCTEIELTNGDKIRVRKSNDKSAYNGFSISLIKNGTTKEVSIEYNEKIKTVDENGKSIEISCEDIFDLPPITQQLFNAQSLDQSKTQKKENKQQSPTKVVKVQRKEKSQEIEHDTMGLSNITDGSQMDDIDSHLKLKKSNANLIMNQL